MQNASEAIQPLNIAAATLLIQFLLLGILAIGVLMLRAGERQGTDLSGRSSSLTTPLFPLILLVAFCSVAVLLASEDFYSIWRPLFGGLQIGTFDARTSITLVFLMDIALLAFLMFVTGGSRDSPFTSMLFMLPALSIFLRESPWRYMTYAFLCGTIFVVLLVRGLQRHYSELNPRYRQTIGFVTVACLALSMFTGYITRPIPLDDIVSSRSLAPERQPSPSAGPAK